ncbi:MAG: hypothetical protein H7233_09870 [Pseudorhodobacter sp.]|nr:hypothetical protein [Frankiaceae bacterium]
MDESNTTSSLSALVQGYREMSVLDAAPRRSHRAWNAVSDRITALLPAVLGDPESWAGLRQVAETDPDPFIRRYAASDADPPAPVDPAQARDRLAHLSVGLSTLVNQARTARAA